MADSAFARFMFDRSLVRADGSVRWKAFLDKRPPHETSVSAHESLRVGIHWDEGARVNPYHAELTGWPLGDDDNAKLQRIDIATDLADASVYVSKEDEL